MTHGIKCTTLEETLQTLEKGNIPEIWGNFELEIRTNCVVWVSYGSPIIKVYGDIHPYIMTFMSCQPHISTHDSSSPCIITHNSSEPRIATYDSSSPHIAIYDLSCPYITIQDNSTYTLSRA